MSDHKTALVPMESWCYSSPELRARGKSVDLGLFAEALIYYDCVMVNLTNQPQFAEFLKWFIAQNRLDDFLALVRDGVVKLYDYAFATATVKDEMDTYSIWNIQDPVQAEPNTFEQRFLYHDSVEAIFLKSRHRKRLYEALRGNVIEVKSEEFGSSVENARKDFHDHRRNALIIQAFVDELYKFRGLGRPPQVEAKVTYLPDATKHNITWNVNFSELARLAGEKLNFHPGTPLTAGAISNRLIWSAAQFSCDLFVAQPMSMLIGDKLYESTEKTAKAGDLIQELKARVEFPDVRKLINEGQLDLGEVLRIRKKAQKFRDWLQQGADRDRDAIIAYHNEVGRELGFASGVQKVLGIFGIIGAGTAGSLVGSVIDGPMGAAVGGTAGSAIGYLANVASKLGANWKPVVFGNWLKLRIEKVIAEKENSKE